MKIVASVAALVLTAVLAGWLWLDATAEARQETAGVMITGAVDPALATEDVRTPAADGSDATPRTDEPGQAASAASGAAASGVAGSGVAGSDDVSATVDTVVSVLQASAGELVNRADEVRQAEREAQKAEESKAAEEEAERAQKAKEKQEKKEAVPVQPAPVNPGGWCEWDDDDGWECEDWDDD